MSLWSSRPAAIDDYTFLNIESKLASSAGRKLSITTPSSHCIETSRLSRARAQKKNESKILLTIGRKRCVAFTVRTHAFVGASTHRTIIDRNLCGGSCCRWCGRSFAARAHARSHTHTNTHHFFRPRRIASGWQPKQWMMNAKRERLF